MWMPGDPLTVRELIRRARLQLVDSDTPLLDVECLLGFVLKCSRAELVLAAQHAPLPDQLAAFEALMARRIKGEPVAYLIGEKPFWDFIVQVSPATLIPRPETETLLSLVIEHMHDHATQQVLELGTGSGVLAIALARTFAGLTVVAVDQSFSALQMAKHNAERLCQQPIQFVCADWCTALDSRFEVIIANPPYISAGDKHLSALQFEPQTALVGGVDGLDALREIIFSSPWYLTRPGWLFLEHGADQGAAVRKAMQDKGFSDIVTHPDLSDQERVTLGVMR